MEASGAEFMGLKGPRSNVIARYSGEGGGPTLHLSAHVDTAPYDPQGWTVDPLGGEHTEGNPYGRSPLDRGGGYVWGRGACDDKSMCVAMTYALEALHELDVKLRGDLVLTGNCDEEIGGVAGLGYLVKEGIVEADYGVQLDGDVFKMGLAAQGRTRFLLKTQGKSYHGQIPILGVNAIEKMSKINVALDRYWRNVLLRRQMAVPGLSLPEGLSEAGIDKLTAMLNIGTIKGGVQGATVPDSCEEEVLRGMIPGESVEDVTRELVEVIEGVRATDHDLRYTVDVINSREGYVVDPGHPFIERSRAIMAGVLGRMPEFSGNLASTDMNYQVNDGGMTCFTMGTGHGYTRYHQKDESVCVDDVVTCAEMLAQIIVDTLGRA
jgi:acetylornithine deacetylase/succinyl-diaminopimelate desuccinylase-like protein